MDGKRKPYFFAFWGSLTGLLAGFLGGIAGLGGGIVMVPMLSLVVGLGQHRAHGTSLSAVFVTGVIASIAYGRYGSVPMDLALTLAFSSSISAFWGARFTRAISGFTLRRWFGWYLILVGVLMIFGNSIIFSHLSLKGTLFWVLVVLIGLLAGFLGSVLGVGGGTVRIPLLAILLGVSQWTAQGVSLFAMIPTSLVGAFTHWKMGNLEMRIAPWLWISIAIGALLGAVFAHLLSGQVLRRIFAVVVGLIGIREIFLISLNHRGR